MGQTDNIIVTEVLRFPKQVIMQKHVYGVLVPNDELGSSSVIFINVYSVIVFM